MLRQASRQKVPVDRLLVQNRRVGRKKACRRVHSSRFGAPHYNGHRPLVRGICVLFLCDLKRLVGRLFIPPHRLFDPHWAIRGGQLPDEKCQTDCSGRRYRGPSYARYYEQYRSRPRQDHAVPLGDLAEPSCVRSRNLHRVLKHLAEESVLVHRSIDQVPHRERGNERLSEHDQFGTGINGLLNQGFQLVDRGVTIEKHWSRLHRCRAELGIGVTWHDDFPPQLYANVLASVTMQVPAPIFLGDAFWVSGRATRREFCLRLGLAGYSSRNYSPNKSLLCLASAFSIGGGRTLALFFFVEPQPFKLRVSVVACRRHSCYERIGD
jgi:hypothetical protein